MWHLVDSRSVTSCRDYLALELLAIQKAVCHFRPLIRGKVVMFQSDNSSAFAYLRNQGDTHSLPRFRLTWDIHLV